jgi:hypothetical protein
LEFGVKSESESESKSVSKQQCDECDVTYEVTARAMNARAPSLYGV